MFAALSRACVLLLPGCDSGGEQPQTATSAPATVPPCGDGHAHVELGNPKWGGPTAEFTTTGGPLYVTARRFEHGGPVDPAVGATLMFVGPVDRPPTFDEQRTAVTNASTELTVREKQFAAFEPSAGRY